MKWSKYQLAFFDFLQNRNGNASIRAVAGSGKSTTIVHGMSLLSSQYSSVFLAFNKSIVEELKSKGVNARTFHSLCASAAFRYTGATTISGDKLSKLMYANFSEEECFLYSSFAIRLVSLAKCCGVGCLQPDTYRIWDAIADHHDVELDVDKVEADYGRALQVSSELLAISNQSNMMDFDDMLYLPVMFNLRLPTFYYVFVDEAQDTNAIRREIIRKILGPNSRLVVVGDPDQAIYGFTGADGNSMALIEKQFNCEVLPLYESYRCATSIVDYARKWVNHIQPCEGAPKGKVVDLSYSWEPSIFQHTDLVLCRTTKPLMGLAFMMLRERIPVTVMGREIGTNLIRMIRKFKANDLESLRTKVEAWAERETLKCIDKEDNSKLAAIEDKSQCLIMLIEEVVNEGGSIETLIIVLEELFTPTHNSTTLATIHKSKGLEADTVYWLNSSKCPSKWAKQNWQKKQEENLCYVATTRAKTKLCLIEAG